MLWRILSIPEHTANKCEGHMLGAVAGLIANNEFTPSKESNPKFTNSDVFSNFSNHFVYMQDGFQEQFPKSNSGLMLQRRGI